MVGTKGLIIVFICFCMFSVILGDDVKECELDGKTFEKGTKLFTSDCRRECTCTNNGKRCNELCSSKPYKCAGDEEPKFKTVKREHKGKVCKCDEFVKCIKK
ncbi:uncharacterized protein LOC113672847 [Pocillopora damicornis]|uniref:uncharacterized protein LOC113672847 n=1 Tax=Pocillopora damicornis TaxID=46731 RepID=UPI000F550280|nr:uncharacterized protein LOC113672847 [Pocillopora damicornis]